MIELKVKMMVELGVDVKVKREVDVIIVSEVDVKVEHLVYLMVNDRGVDVKVESEVYVKESIYASLSARKSHSSTGDYRPTFCKGKHYQFVPEPILQHYKKMKESKDICCTVLSLTMVPVTVYGILFIVRTPSSIENQEVYQVTLSDFLACTCLGFVSMKEVVLGNGRKKWILCKHLYFVLQRQYLVTSFDKFIHCLVWTMNQVKTILDRFEMVQLLE